MAQRRSQERRVKTRRMQSRLSKTRRVKIRRTKTKKITRLVRRTRLVKKLRKVQPASRPRNSQSRLGMNCIARSLIPLQPWQRKVVKYMDKYNGLLVVHSTGLGKTITAITVSQCFIDLDPLNRIVFVGPAGLISNFQKQMEKYGVENDDRYSFYSFDKFLGKEKGGDKVVCNKNTLLIVDEAHNLRNPDADFEKDARTEKPTKQSSVLNCALNAGKRLLLTATPFVNNIEDFIPLINMIHGKRIFGTKKQVRVELAQHEITKPLLERYLNKRVDMVTFQDEKNFPEKFIMYINVPMSPAYYADYIRVISSSDLFDNPERFYNGHRRAVNNAGSEYFSAKIERIAPIITEQKSVIFTNWIEFGIKPIEKTLNGLGIKHQKITGETNRMTRQEIVDAFNFGKFQVLIITKAGSEGIDLHGVRNLIVLEPVWNYAGLEQIIGRVVRYNSHAHLPPSERNVNIFLMVSTEPEVDSWEITEGSTSDSGDRILYNIIRQKYAMNEDFMKLLKKCSI